jgi:hypothetical protein
MVVALTVLMGLSLTGPGAAAVAAPAPAKVSTDDVPPELASYYAQTLVWSSCEDQTRVCA